jgi:hypothetical protein
MAKLTPSDIYRNTLNGAAEDGALLIGKLISTARPILQAREAACRDLRERDALVVSQKQLRAFEPELSKRYPTVLLKAFTHNETGRAQAVRSLTQVSFDELELMDETEVQSSVAMGRVQQLTLQAVEAVLAELNTLVCGAQGLGSVLAERNPLRPQVYIQALREVIEQTQVSPSVQVDWLGAMGPALGPERRKLYLRYCETLRGQGVMAAGYVVSAAQVGVGIGRGVAQDSFQAPQGGVPRSAPVAAPTSPVAPPPTTTDSRLLTLDRLHMLLTGELAHAPQGLSDKERFAQQFSQQFERNGGHRQAVDAPATDFDATVPAALEALKDMAQVQVVVQRLENRRNPAFLASAADDLESVRACLRASADGVVQTLGLEVVSLMVENIAKDPRLLPSVQKLVRSLEPALLLLSLVDARLFSSKAHPARQLLMDITERSLAYTSEDAAGVGGFLTAVEAAIAPLRTAPIEGPEPFEQALAVLHQKWQRLEQLRAPQRNAAVDALVHAEQRSVLAEKIAAEIARHPEARGVPAVVVEFLCRPWALVLAQARLDRHASDGGARAKNYQAAIGALLWSAHPDLPRQNLAKLTRLVPNLLAMLREGLDSIGYPTAQTSAFLDALMGLHQRAFRAGQKAQPLPVHPEPVPEAVPSLIQEDPWVAPQEAEASNFIDLAPDASASPECTDVGAGTQDSRAVVMPDDSDLPLGAWVELQIGGQWVRTQLTWASPHKTLFLFTTGGGSTQSMTRRSRDKLMATGLLRIVSERNVVDGALNAVAEEAMRNSVNTTY